MKIRFVKTLLCILPIYILISCNTSSSIAFEEPKVLNLDSGWVFSEVGKDVWLKASVPGTIHQDLFSNGLIPDPFIGLNESKVQWVESKDWEYKTTFNVPSELFEKSHIELNFTGLDTYAEVFLNDNLILSSNNMFRSWKVDCKKYLQKENNSLRVVFLSPVKIGQDKLSALGFLIPVVNEQAPKGKQNSVFTRKAAFHFGWDWGPRLVTCGIWQPIKLSAWSDSKIVDVALRADTISKEKAIYTAEVSTISDIDKNVTIHILVDSIKLVSKEIKISKGENVSSVQFTINNPQYWWSVGLGNQKLYKVQALLEYDSKVADVYTQKLGVRTLKVIQKPDSIGKSFWVELNGIPVFVKGANYIPGDNLIPRVTNEKYKRVIEEALAANMNGLRVWGGAVYEKDIFYELCAEKGLLIYHDFMFACSMYPGDKAFSENVKLEAIEQVKRLRKYPNIYLWAGNNEILNGWHEWNFQERFGFDDKQKDTLWKFYNEIFYKVLPEVVAQYDPEKLYWSCSPQSSHGVLQNPSSGDQHLWSVWFNEAPFSEYEKKPGRFISEYGFQSYPNMNTIKDIVGGEIPNNLNWDSEVLLKRQRSPMPNLGLNKNGNHMIHRYLLKEFKKPKDFFSYIYVSQLLHAQCLKTASHAHRNNKPYTMGSMFWQLNDCWPTISWATVDYYGDWKAAHYQIKNDYQDVIVSSKLAGDSVLINIVSDLATERLGKLSLAVKDFDGRILQESQLDVRIDAFSSSIVAKISIENLIKQYGKNRIYAQIILKEGDVELDRDNCFFVKHKDLELPKADLSFDVSEKNGSVFVNVRANKFAKNVYLFLDGIHGNFSDNFFDLDHNTNKTVEFMGAVSVEEIKRKLKIISLVDTY